MRCDVSCRARCTVPRALAYPAAHSAAAVVALCASLWLDCGSQDPGCRRGIMDPTTMFGPTEVVSISVGVIKGSPRDY